MGFFDFLNKPSVTEQDRAVIDEVIGYIDGFKKLCTGKYPIVGETLGIFQIIPVNAQGAMYKSDSDIVELLICIYDDSEWRMQSIKLAAETSNSNFLTVFHKEKNNGNDVFVGRTISKFTCNYRKFMHSLYTEVNNCFPGKFKFDGSRIMSCDNYPDSIF